MLPFLAGCAGSHVVPLGPDLSVFATAASADQVRAAVPDAAALDAAWTCGPLPAPLSVAAAGEVWDRCDLADLAPRARFAAASGDRALAARLFVWLRSQGVGDAALAPRLLLGEPPFDGEIALPVVPGEAGPVEAAFLTVAAPIRDAGTWGRFPYWHLASGPSASGLALDASAPVGTLRRLLATHAADGRALPVLVADDDGLGTVSLAVPGADAAVTVAYAAGAPLALPPEGVARITVGDEVSVGALLAALGPATGRRVELAMDHAPCLAPPGPGMRCVEGDAGLGTFYVDEAADGDLTACRTAEICRSAPGTWASAEELCRFRGKRLPTRWEADRAGLAAPATWTQTWDGAGDPPHGACDGAPKCASSAAKRLTDGTARPPTATVAAPPRCVSSEPWLTTWPPAVVARPSPPLPLPSPPTEAELAIAWAVRGDTLDDKGICGEDVRAGWRDELQKGGRSTTSCRDPYSYVTTNEPDRHLFERFLANAGGIYVGVGSDQSYDFVAEQRPQWAFVFDYDPNVVRFHQVMQAFLRAADTRQRLVALWGPDHTDEAERLLAEAWPADATVLQTYFHGYRRRIHGSLGDQLTPSREAPTFGFLATDENYAVIHTLAVQRRIVPVGVDLLETVGLRSIGDAARALGAPVRVYYTSNAPTAWGGQATPEYKQNVRSLPMDDRSMVLATFNSGAWHQTGRWRYDVMHGLLQQERLGLSAYTDNRHPTWDRIPGDHGNLTVVRLPSAWPAGG
jgi:hypothetical protein